MVPGPSVMFLDPFVPIQMKKKQSREKEEQEEEGKGGRPCAMSLIFHTYGEDKYPLTQIW